MIGFRDLLGSLGRAAFGTWVKLPSTDSVELLAAAGFDFLVLDMEHAPLDIGTVHQLIGAATGRGLPALVRVPDRGPSTIARVLDSGAAGVLVPHVDTVAQARAVVAAGRFPPHGNRGFGPTVRAGGWGRDTAGYSASGERVTIVAQLESRQAVDAVRDVAAVEGLGALFVGPADLSIETGLAGNSAKFTALLDQVQVAAKEMQIPLGTATGSGASAQELAHRYNFVLLSNDASMLGSAAASLLDEAKRG